RMLDLGRELRTQSGDLCLCAPILRMVAVDAFAQVRESWFGACELGLEVLQERALEQIRCIGIACSVCTCLGSDERSLCLDELVGNFLEAAVLDIEPSHVAAEHAMLALIGIEAILRLREIRA